MDTTPYRIPEAPIVRSLRTGDRVRLTDQGVALLRDHWHCKAMTRDEHERGFFVPPYGIVQALTGDRFPMAYVQWNDPFVSDGWCDTENLQEAP